MGLETSRYILFVPMITFRKSSVSGPDWHVYCGSGEGVGTIDISEVLADFRRIVDVCVEGEIV